MTLTMLLMKLATNLEPTIHLMETVVLKTAELVIETHQRLTSQVLDLPF